MDQQDLGWLNLLLSNFHQLSSLYASHTTPFHPHDTNPLLLSPSLTRWCFFNLDENSLEENCSSVDKSAEKTGKCRMDDHYEPPPIKRSKKEKNRGNRSASLCSLESMEPEIWKEFPEDLLEAVIARLPIATFFRFRSVCRRWDSLLTSPSFSEHCLQVPHPGPWFYTIAHENVDTGAIYDPSMKKWLQPIKPSLFPKVTLLPVASAGGLVCFLDIGHRYFYICNP